MYAGLDFTVPRDVQLYSWPSFEEKDTLRGTQRFLGSAPPFEGKDLLMAANVGWTNQIA